jgi:hypothetical protein
MERMTVQQAIDAGHKYFKEETEGPLMELAHYLPGSNNLEELNPKMLYVVCLKKPMHFQLAEGEIAELIVDRCLNNDDYGDEDGVLSDIAEEELKKHTATLEALTNALNEKLATINFYTNDDIELLWQQ